MSVVTFDFETEGIEARPDYPPKPVGVAIKEDGQPSVYWSWGHPTENNCTFEEAKRELAKHWNSNCDFLCHNAKFDFDVAETHMGLAMPPWERIHDTQYLIYLYDVHAKSFSLKPSAERILDWPPEEQDKLRDWILGNVPGASSSKRSKNYWAKYICLAPGDLAGEYAEGDTDRTYALYVHLLDYIVETEQVGAYDRERELMPILLGAERHGIQTAWSKMEEDYHSYSRVFQKVDDTIRDLLGAPSLNPGSGAQLADALLRSGYATSLPTTPTGRPSTARDALQSAVDDPYMRGLLAYRGMLKTCLGTFLGPWVAQANANRGRIHTQWHQTRGDADKGGTVTGRLSSIGPNFMNVPNELPSEEGLNFPPLPRMRDYLLPDLGHTWLKRDYSAQEVRILAHFEDGALMRAFTDNPRLDPHQFGADVIREQTGHSLDRSMVKIIVFSILYGSGINHLSKQLKVPYHQAAQVKQIYLNAFPDVQGLMADIKSLGRSGRPVRTTGGRVLYAEPSRDGRDFSYKLLNHLIQGSAADVTKQSIIYHHKAKKSAEFLATVHDENNISAPVEVMAQEMVGLRQAMEAVKLDVLLLSQGYQGETWEQADQHKWEPV